MVLDELFEDLLLERVRPQVEEERRVAGAGESAAGGLEGLFQAGVLFLVERVDAFELGVHPEAIEGAAEQFDHVAQVSLAGLHRPFKTAGQRACGQVGAADPHRAEAGLAMEEPGLGVDAAAPAVERDSDLGAGQRCQRVDGGGFGGASVGGSEESEVLAGLGVLFEGSSQSAKAAPGDEADQGVHAIG